MAATGGGGSGGSPPLQKRTGGNGDEDPLDGGGGTDDVDGVLAAAGASAAELPADLRDALARGVLSAELLRRWLRLARTPLLGPLAKAIPGFRDRIMGNPRFLLVLTIELAMGVSAKTSAEIKARGDKFGKEINFVMSDLALEVVGDAAIVWLLSPKASFAAKAGGGGPIASLPGYCLQVGDYSVVERVSTLMYRGFQFLGVGFGASVIGHGLTKYLVDKQEAGMAEADRGKPLASVLDNSLGWGSFMMVSSNTRYQIVNTIEERLLDPFVPSLVLRNILIFALRFGNTFVGGEQWVRYAAMIGLQ